MAPDHQARWQHRCLEVILVQPGTEAGVLVMNLFEKGDKPSLILSTLEALAALFSQMVFFEPPSGGERTRVQVAPTWTDNRAS